jgi:hypothetical protein
MAFLRSNDHRYLRYLSCAFSGAGAVQLAEGHLAVGALFLTSSMLGLALLYRDHRRASRRAS